MSVVLSCFQKFTATLADGTYLEIGSASPANTLTLTNGRKYEAIVQIADDYTADTIWETGDGGMATFEVLLLYSDNAIVLELRSDVAGDEFVLLKLQGGVWHMLTTDDIGGYPTATRLDGAVLVEDTDFAQVDQINVQRDVADAIGDAEVHLILLN